MEMSTELLHVSDGSFGRPCGCVDKSENGWLQHKSISIQCYHTIVITPFKLSLLQVRLRPVAFLMARRVRPKQQKKVNRDRTKRLANPESQIYKSTQIRW
jgi:hypothetical protein